MASVEELPLVSVYLPTRNRLALLGRAVKSVFAQTYPNIELVVADDDSTDGSRDYLRALESAGRLRVVSAPAAMGASVARNLAIAASRGEFVTGLDDDDYFLPDRIAGFIDAWKKANARGERIAGIFSPVRLLSANGEYGVFTAARVTEADLRRKNGVGTQIFAPRAHFVGAGLFDPAMPCWQDWDMWLRMAANFGDFVSSRQMSYVWDLTGQKGHISNKPEFMIRHGYRLFLHKAGLHGFNERAGPLSVLSLYPQVNLGVGELGMLMMGGFARPAVRYMVRRVCGESRLGRGNHPLT